MYGVQNAEGCRARGSAHRVRRDGSIVDAGKGVRTQAELLRLLEKEGFKASQSGLSGWLYGRYSVTKDSPPVFARALKPDEEQKRRLAWAYTFGQNERLTIDDLLL